MKYYNITVARVQSVFVPNIMAETEEDAIEAAFSYIEAGESDPPEYSKWAVEAHEVDV